MKKILFLVATFMFLASCDDTRVADTVESPSGDLALEVYLTDSGQAAYKISYRDMPVIEESLLGFQFNNAPALDDDFSVVEVVESTFDQTWEQPWGEKHFVRNHYNQMHIRLREESSPARELDLVFRVYDTGVGFRYELPRQDSLTDFEITDELTQFNLTGNHTAWWTPAQAGNQYEYLYRKTPLNEVELVHTPITMKTATGHFVMIHEAALHDYSTMNLAGAGQNLLQAELVPWAKETPVKVKGTTPFATPWRTIEIADKATDLITSYLTLNLNEPSKLKDTSWIKPGKYIGIWWELHLEKGTWKQGPKHGATTANTKKYIDFAARHGFDGVLVEGWNHGWDGEWWNHGGGEFNFTKPYPDYDIEELSRYAKEKDVYIIGHHETGADTDNYESQLEEAYEFLQEYGMRAVKTGYVETGELLTNGHYHQGQFFVRHADKVTQMAADHQIMLVAHETVKDTGERRTWPNLMSREVARGQEYNAWSDDGGNPPDHTTILPFTRMLSGPMDFTPGIFELTLPSRPKNQVNTTLAKQLALYVVIYSPVQMAADLPENYEKYLDAFQFIKDVAVDWETTKVLGGKIGDYIAIARQQRGTNNWFIGAITDENKRDLNLSLGFLKPGQSYKARIYKDAPDAHYKNNPAAYVIEEKTVTATDKLILQLAAGGGAAISLIAVN